MLLSGLLLYNIYIDIDYLRRMIFLSISKTRIVFLVCFWAWTAFCFVGRTDHNLLHALRLGHRFSAFALQRHVVPLASYPPRITHSKAAMICRYNLIHPSLFLGSQKQEKGEFRTALQLRRCVDQLIRFIYL